MKPWMCCSAPYTMAFTSLPMLSLGAARLTRWSSRWHWAAERHPTSKCRASHTGAALPSVSTTSWLQCFRRAQSAHTSCVQELQWNFSSSHCCVDSCPGIACGSQPEYLHLSKGQHGMPGVIHQPLVGGHSLGTETTRTVSAPCIGCKPFQFQLSTNVLATSASATLLVLCLILHERHSISRPLLLRLFNCRRTISIHSVQKACLQGRLLGSQNVSRHSPHLLSSERTSASQAAILFTAV